MSAEANSTGAGRLSTWVIWAMAAIGVFGCLAVIGIAVVAFGLSYVGGGHGPAKVEAVATHEVFTVDNVGAVPGTTLIRMDVEASDDQRGSSSRSASGDRRNVVLLDTATGASRRILADNSRRITDFRFLDHSVGEPSVVVRDESDGAGDAALWYMATIDQPGATGLEDVMIGSSATAKQAVVLTGIDGIDAAWVADATHIALIVRDHRKLSYRLIDTASFKVSASHPIAID